MIKLKLANIPYYKQLMRTEKPIGWLLLLWPTYWALWLANEGFPPLHLLVVFTLGVFLMRSAGCVINDYADREYDGHVERTKQRPLAAGLVTPQEAIQLFILLSLLAFLLVLSLNFATILLSVVALLLAAIYPFMKRYTHLPQVVLGAAFGWSIPMAFMASTDELPTIVWWLYLANLLWTVAYDTYYAMVDREDDLLIGVKSTAILFGRFDLAIIVLLQLAVLAIFTYLGLALKFNVGFWVGVGLAASLFSYQLIIALKKERDKCFTAFINNNSVGLALFLAIASQFVTFYPA